MYQRRSNLQNLMILLLDCLTIVVSLILANYIRNGRLFESDDARMDFGLLLGAVLVVFLAMNLFCPILCIPFVSLLFACSVDTAII